MLCVTAIHCAHVALIPIEESRAAALFMLESQIFTYFTDRLANPCKKSDVIYILGKLSRSIRCQGPLRRSFS